MLIGDWHRRVLGPEAGHLQAGLVALTGGIVLGLSGVALYVFGEATSANLAWRKAAITMAALAAPMIFGGISLALPARLGLRAIAALGISLNLAATWLFFLHYPHRFNAGLGADRAPMDTALYAVGSALLAGALLAQIVGVYVRGRGDPDSDTWQEAGYELPDWLIEKDIDDAMAKHPVSWGAGAGKGESIAISVAGFGQDTVVRGHGVAKRVTLAVADLEGKSERVRNMGAASVSVQAAPIVDATTALADLHRLQAAHPKQFRPPRASWWKRLRRWWAGVWSAGAR